MESKRGSHPPKALPRSGSPRHFHLIWDTELDELQEALHSIQKHRAKVLEHWYYDLYVLHFADSHALNRTEFMEIFGNELDTTQRDLIDKDIDRFAADLRRIGELLAERSVPFSELIVSMHLFEESATTAFPPSSRLAPHIYQSFDKLSHIRIIVLADTYFRSKSAVSGERIQALEREAAALSARAAQPLPRLGGIERRDATAVRTG